MKKEKKIIIIVSVLLLVIVACTLLFHLSKSRTFQFFGNIYASIPNDSKKVALTFDDGPTENTNAIVMKLNELDITATFFLCGSDIEKCPEEAKLLADSGFSIGNHSYSHERMWFKSYSFYKDEIEKTNELIRKSGYEGEIYFRPPYGKKLFVLPFYLKQSEIKTIMWNIEPETDLGFDATSEQIATDILEKVKSGSIILLHPMYNSENVLGALDIVVPELIKQGYSFCSIDEMLNHAK